jgi:hypothetical protein
VQPREAPAKGIPYVPFFPLGGFIEVLADDIDRLAREVKDMKSLPPARKRRIGFIIDDD